MADKIINITNIGSLISYIKAKCVAWFWPKDDVQDIDLATVATTGSYNDLLDKPTAATGAIIYIGTCPTAAATATKVVTTTAFPTQNGAPVVGIVIGVKYSNTNTATEPKLNVNGLGAVGIYYNAAVATSTSAVYGGTKNRYTYYMWDGTYWCWLSQGNDANDNTIAYQVRSSGQRLPVATACYRYRLLFTSADGTKLVPANSSSSTNATASRTPTTAKIDPFGQILYYSYTTALSANGQPSASYQHEQYSGISIGYSFNNTGAAATMTFPAPIYIKCAPQSDGSAIIDSTTPYVQALPSTADGKIYIFLGIAISATTFELLLHHPVYYFADGAIRAWNNAAAATDVVKYSSQSLTDAQKLQARTNIGAMTLGDDVLDITNQPPTTSPSGETNLATVLGVSVADLQLVFDGKKTKLHYADGNYHYIYTVLKADSVTYDVYKDLVLQNGTNIYRYVNDFDAGGDHEQVTVTNLTPSSGTLITNATTAQAASSGESMSGSITLHKVAKTGTYSDLIGTPTIPTVPTISTNIQSDKASDAKTASPKAVYDHVDGITGDLTDLQTTDKSSLVAAINEAIPKDFRLIASGTVPEDTARVAISTDNNGQPFSLKDVIVFARLYGNSGGYTGWIKMDLTCATGTQASGDISKDGMFAANPDEYYTVLTRWERIGNKLMPMLNYRSLNKTSVKNSLTFLQNTYAVENNGLTDVSGGITKVTIYGYQATALGAGTYYEIYGIDA